MKRKNILMAMMALWLAGITCNLPSGQMGLVDEIAQTGTSLALTVQANGAPQQNAVINTETPTSTPTLEASLTPCPGTVTANSNVNVRTGPGTVYDVIGFIPQGSTAPLAGKNDDGSWWYIQFPAGPGGHGWMAGSVSTAACIPASLPVIAAPPTPTPPPPTVTSTPTLILLIPMIPMIPLNPAAGDIEIQDVFLATTGEIVVRVAVNPTNSLSGNVTYKVWVDGGLEATRTEALPAGSVAYWSGVTISGSHTVKVKIDTSNSYAETNEGNNTVEVTLSH